jgi:hypothetical protein
MAVPETAERETPFAVPPEMDTVLPEMAEVIRGLVQLLLPLEQSMRVIVKRHVDSTVALHIALHAKATTQHQAPVARSAALMVPPVAITSNRTRVSAQPTSSSQRRSPVVKNRTARRLNDATVQERARTRQVRALHSAPHPLPAVPTARVTTSRAALASEPCAPAMHETLGPPSTTPAPPVQTLTPLNATSQPFSPRVQQDAEQLASTELHRALRFAQQAQQVQSDCVTPMSVPVSPEMAQPMWTLTPWVRPEMASGLPEMATPNTPPWPHGGSAAPSLSD